MTYVCDSLANFRTKVLSSKGKEYYDVVHLSTGWNCTCPAFAFRGGQCKHIIQAKDEVCEWKGDDPNEDGTCPRCGADVVEKP